MRVFASILLTFSLGVLTAPAAIVDFDSISASCCFSDVTPGGARGPVLVFGNATFDGGVVMDNTGWNDMETSFPNLYGTSDYSELSDFSVLPGFITITFLSPVSFVTLDIINGSDASDFTLSAYDGLSALLGSSVVSLTSFGQPGSVASASVNFAGIKSVIITSAQGEGSIDFAIDTVNFSDTGVPEPATWLSVAGGLAVLALRRKRAA
ncbi:MAG: PEP-CTERM sorting domain-containing protein [Acidobacteriota bacterium]